MISSIYLSLNTIIECSDLLENLLICSTDFGLTLSNGSELSAKFLLLLRLGRVGRKKLQLIDIVIL
jgi:hypothetical protein